MKESVCDKESSLVSMRLFEEGVKDRKRYVNLDAKIAHVLFSIITVRDDATARHSLLMAFYNYLIAKKFDPLNCEDYFIGGLVHDIGKVGMSDHILKGKYKASEGDMEEIRLHVTHGVNIVTKVGFSEVVHNITKYHHERFNGSGYLEGLGGYSIPLPGRISAIADTYSTLVEGRKYSTPRTPKESIAIMERESLLFDPDIFKWFKLLVLTNLSRYDLTHDFLLNFSNNRLFSVM